MRKQWWRLLVLTAGIYLTAAAAWAFDVSVTEHGISIKADNMGDFTIEPPVLMFNGKEEGPSGKRMDGGKLLLEYPCGAKATLAKDGNSVSANFANVPGGAKYKVGMYIPGNYKDGAKWKIKGREEAFPAQHTKGKPHLYQGNAGDLTLISFDGKKIVFKWPADYCYEQLTDNREWNWGVFYLMVSNTVASGQTEKFTITNDVSQAKRVIRVDKYGQTTEKDFPGKLKDDSEMKSEVESEKAYYASFKPLKTDKYGGLPGTGAKLGLKKTGFFHVEKKGAKWILVDPEGNAFFHLGVCSFHFGEDFTYIEGREDIYEWLPPHDGDFNAAWHHESWWNPRAVSFYAANLVRKYGKLVYDEWVERMIARIRAFGFNSIGAFSGSPVFDKAGIPWVGHLPVWCPEVPGIRGVFDPFNPDNDKKLDEGFANLAKSADNPLIIGYFLANEQGWEGLPRAVPALDGKHACKKRLVKMLEEKYKTVDKFNAAWKLSFKSFAEMNDAALALKSDKAFADMLAYNELFLEAYYKAITTTFRKYDKNHMLIGNRWQPGTANSEVLCKVAGKYMDVISINYYTKAIDSQFIRRIYKWTGEKPQFWSEFYYTCDKESNVGGSGMDVGTQRNRGQAYRNYVEGGAALGFVVGIEWFTLTDQAVTGRFFERYNGERNNTGLFNVLDRPYKATVEEMAKTNKEVYGVWLDGKKPFVFDNPQFSSQSGAKQSAEAGHANGSVTVDGQLDASWPGRPPVRISGARLVSGRDAEGFEADFKVCWDEQNLYLLVNVKDPTPMRNEQSGGNLWNGDGAELFFGSEQPTQGGALIFTDRQIFLGAGRSGQFHVVNADEQPAIKTAVAMAVDGQGWTLEAAIPWRALNVGTPQAGDEFLFDLAIDDGDGGGRIRQLMWNGSERNSSDRGGWGRLKLAR